MDFWLALLFVAAAGAIGGVLNALSTENAFPLPQPVKDNSGRTVAWRAGALGNILMGTAASAVSWGLYGPSSAYLVVGKPQEGTVAIAITLSLASLASALLVGYGGARWLTNEFDKRLLKAAASAAASGAADATKATQIANASPAKGMSV